MAKTTIGLIQMAAEKDADQNLQKAIDRISLAADAGAQILCLQELFRSTYFCRDYDEKNFKLAETIPGPTTDRLGQVARERSLVIIAPLFEKRAGGIYHNSAVVIDADGAVVGNYRKMHLPDDPNFYEKFYFTPGDLGFRVHKTKYARLGILVCWDQWFPEAARLAALGGAEILFYPSAIAWNASEAPNMRRKQLSGWEVIHRGHAVANGLFVAVTNRVGREGTLTFWGHSFVADPFGRVLASAAEDKEENLIVECDLEEIEETRQGWPFLRDRRIDAYSAITQRFLDENSAS